MCLIQSVREQAELPPPTRPPVSQGCRRQQQMQDTLRTVAFLRSQMVGGGLPEKGLSFLSSKNTAHLSN